MNRNKNIGRKPALRQGMSVADFKACYWMKDELIAFARRLELPTGGYKPELAARIERRLRGLPVARPSAPKPPKGPRDSDEPLSRSTPVVNYSSDEKTRAFFTDQIGPHFHFTYHVNQFRLAHENLTYGNLIDEWIAEYDRRKSRGYKAPIASHGEYNRHVRDFFADPANRGKTLREAVLSWKAAKRARGDRRYKPQARKRSLKP